MIPTILATTKILVGLLTVLVVGEMIMIMVD